MSRGQCDRDLGGRRSDWPRAGAGSEALWLAGGPERQRSDRLRDRKGSALMRNNLGDLAAEVLVKMMFYDEIMAFYD